MDNDDLKRLYRFEDGLLLYDKFFPNCPANAIRLEATPDYLYRPAVAKRVAESLLNVHIVIILREPIARLISWRRYAIQNGQLDPDTTLAEYIQMQFDAEVSNEATPQHLRSLREGRYAHYLEPWVQQFGQDRLMVFNYRTFMEEPVTVVRQICDSLGIDSGFFNDYSFDVLNASRRVCCPRIHAVYRSLIWRLKPMVHDRPGIRSVLRGCRRATDALLGRTGKGRVETGPGDVLSESDRHRLEEYYGQEPTALAQLLRLDEWVW